MGPVTGKEKRTWHPAGPDRTAAEKLAQKLAAAVKRGMLTRNVALVAHAQRLRSIPKHEAQAWTADRLSVFLQAAIGHRLFPAFWLAANTGMLRSKLLGLHWRDIDLDKATVSISRGLVAIGYEHTGTRGKTANSRRSIDLDPTTVDILGAWKTWTTVQRRIAGVDADYVFTTAEVGYERVTRLLSRSDRR